MKHITYFATILLISFVLITSCKGQDVEENQEDKIEQKKIKQLKAINLKDKKELAKFIDTLILDRFYMEIDKFKKDDSLQPYKTTDIVFVGSSSIRKWKDLKKDMKNLNVLNRGFGGSTVPEAIFYSDILILKHKPKKIVFYSGDNDIADLKSSTDQIIESYKYFFRLINKELPNTSLFILSIKPSPARWRYWKKAFKINTQLTNICAQNSNYTFIDVSSSMIDSTGNLNAGLFLKDRIHLNKKGYKLWADIIFPVISENTKTENK
ncbi:MAG: GDSL-type esterase/lipase family protein [Bacteroidota bacterium]